MFSLFISFLRYVPAFRVPVACRAAAGDVIDIKHRCKLVSMGMKAAVRILIFVFVLGIIVELFYVVPLIIAENDPALVYERAITAGITISILIVLVVVLNRQRKLKEEIRSLESQVPPRTSAEVRKEMDVLKKDLNALDTVFKDGLMEKDEYEERKRFINGELKKKRLEAVNLERSERKARLKEKKEGKAAAKPSPKGAAKGKSGSSGKAGKPPGPEAKKQPTEPEKTGKPPEPEEAEKTQEPSEKGA